MNGKQASSPPSPEERLTETERTLDEFEKSLGLPRGCPERLRNETQEIMALPKDVLRKMSGGELGEAAFSVQRFAYWVQQSLDRESSVVLWAEEAVKKIISPLLSSQKGQSFEERKLSAVASNETASRCDAIRIRARLRMERLAYLSNKLESVARTLQSLRKSREDNE